jgi:hypothetical protein
MNTQAVLNFFDHNTGNILSGIIASFIVLVLQSSANVAATVFANIVLQRYRLSKLWCFPRCDRVYVISGSLEGVSQEVRNVILAGPDSDASSSAIATLGMLYPKTEIRHVYSSNFSADFAKDNICVIGGPVNNQISKQLLTFFKGKITFDNNDNLIAFGKTYSPEYGLDDKCTIDYGILIQVSNPLFSDARTIAFMGCETFGVLAASLAASNRLDGREARREIERRLGFSRFFRRPSYVAVVSCNVLDNDIVGIRLEDIHPV